MADLNDTHLPESLADEYRYRFGQQVQGGFVHISLESMSGDVLNIKISKSDAKRLRDNLDRCI